MAVLRFRLKTLIVAIAFLALLLAVGLLSVENAKLRRFAALERQRALAEEARARAQAEQTRRVLLDLLGTTPPPSALRGSRPR
jgi:hypothetical protein